MARFVVGIDLGTTNSALAYVDAGQLDQTAEPPTVERLSIPQLIGPGDVAERPGLPSFLYLPGDKEFPAGSLDLPWKKKADRVVGALARDQGAKVPGRLVGSAKSWLSHSGVDRRGAILPWTASPELTKLSPVEVSAAYLAHLRDAWNHLMAGKVEENRLEKQDVLITVPASFDPVARELTVEAARLAGLDKITLLEEPQAAFYAWLARRGESWRQAVHVGDRILVCDVGGGTTDFTLITVGEHDGDLSLTREAVGEHILLGGDNMDLSLAYVVASGLPGGMGGLDAAQRVGLTYACRNAKETLFTHPDRDAATVAVLGRGSKVVGGSVKTELTREVLNKVLLDGFFPACSIADAPERGRRMGLTEIGLPYATDPAISRHLARFLSRQADSLHAQGAAIHPSAVLFNGGVFQAAALRERVVEVLSTWAGVEVPSLDSSELDLAVARGAAYYGLVRRGRGIRIRGGVSRSYYVGIETATPAVPGIRPPIKAVCVVPMGMEEGSEADIPGQEFGLVVGEPSEFRFLSSTTRRDDAIGTVLERWEGEELQEHAPLETSLRTEGGREGETVPVRLHSNVTELGTLELWCESTRTTDRWKLEYNVRDSAEA